MIPCKNYELLRSWTTTKQASNQYGLLRHGCSLPHGNMPIKKFVGLIFKTAEKVQRSDWEPTASSKISLLWVPPQRHFLIHWAPAEPRQSSGNPALRFQSDWQWVLRWQPPMCWRCGSTASLLPRKWRVSSPQKSWGESIWTQPSTGRLRQISAGASAWPASRSSRNKECVDSRVCRQFTL